MPTLATPAWKRWHSKAYTIVVYTMAKLVAIASLLLVLVAGASALEDDEHETNGYRLKFIGKSAKFEAGTNTSYMRVDFGQVTERAAGGDEVSFHQVKSLEALETTYSTGVEDVDSTNVTFVQMRLPFANLSGNFKYQAGSCSPNVSEAEYLAGYLSIKVYFGFAKDVVFPYGFNNTIAAPGKSAKFAIEVQNWPFCTSSNTLDVAITISTPKCEACTPKISNYTDSDEEDAGTSASSSGADSEAGNSTSGSYPSAPGRKILAKTGQQPSTMHKPAGHEQEPSKPSGPRDPRVAGRRKDKVALVTGDGKAAVLDFTTYAFDTINGSTLYNVTADIQQDGPHTKVVLSFPYFTSLYYDPTMEVNVNATDAGYTAAELIATPQSGTGAKSAAGCVKVHVLASMAAGLLLLALLL